VPPRPKDTETISSVDGLENTRNLYSPSYYLGQSERMFLQNFAEGEMRTKTFLRAGRVRVRQSDAPRFNVQFRTRFFFFQCPAMLL
jgi:hypothetical protein